MTLEGKEKRVELWEKEIEMGIKYRQKFTTYDLWPTFRQQYRGKGWNPGIIPVNRVFSNGRSMLPRVYFRTPTVMVSATRPEFSASARIVEAVDNWMLRTTRMKYTIKRAALEAYITGCGPIKLGYDSEFGFNPDLAVDENFGSATQYGSKDGSNIEYRSNIHPGTPWALPVKPDDIVTPWGYQDAQSFPWIAHAIWRPLEDAKQDTKYNSNRHKLKGDWRQHLKIRSPFENKEVDEKKYVQMWEVRDVKEKKIIILAEGMILLEQEDALQLDGLPWKFIIFNEDPDFFYGISDVYLNSPQQKELNECRTQASFNRRLSVLKWLYAKGAFKPEDLEKLLSQDLTSIGCGIEAQDVDNLQTAILPLQPHNTVSDTTAEQRNIEADMRETFGYSLNQLGEFSPYHNKTATESKIVEQGSNLRSDERRDIVVDCVSEIVEYWNKMIFSYWSTQRVIEVVGPTGEKFWVEFSGKDIEGEYAYRIDPDSGIQVSQQVRYEATKELWNLIKGDPQIDQVEIKKMLLRQFDWIDPVASSLVREAPMPPPEVLTQMGGGGPKGLEEMMALMGQGNGKAPKGPMKFQEFQNMMKGGKGQGAPPRL